MPIVMTADTRCALGPDASKCESRSLYFARFADPAAKDRGSLAPRKDWFRRGISLKPVTSRIEAWGRFIAGATPQDESLLYAQLQSRMMVNMAGGVMENAGLCLDRFGLPYIPGSAVKGCSRRMAIQSLLESRESGEEVDLLAEKLASLAEVFGWGERDWSDKKEAGRFASDFAYAIGEKLWKETSTFARKVLPTTDSFSGKVSFLPAHPIDTHTVPGLPLHPPELGKLELDVVTCHHGDYYANPSEKPFSDTEEPVPVFFPAVAEGQVFTFAVLPLRNCAPTLLRQARDWLAVGLHTFGLGAKTAAGYGWFGEVSGAIRKANEESRNLAEIKATRASLQPDGELLEKLKSLKEPDLRSQINQFSTEERFWTVKDERTQLTILHFLYLVEPGKFTDDRAKPSSKIAKTITHLSVKFPHVVPAKP